MVALHPQFVHDASHATTAVLVPWEEWKAVVEELEELDALRAYDAAKAEPQEFVDFEDAVKELGDKT
ncbi:MAG: hypothetical protein RL173_3563 [Fibrobacterota bacterium]|jgi:hypothetical protein